MHQPRKEPRLEPVTVLLPAEERAALRREALRRMEAGQARRIDSSAIIREALAAWRRQAAGGEG